MYNIYYLKSANDFDENDPIWKWTFELSCGLNEGCVPTQEEFETRYACVADLEDYISLDEIFHLMQAENWSPNGEARDLIIRLGLSHTSMWVGDIIEDVEDEKFYIVRGIGFEEIKLTQPSGR